MNLCRVLVSRQWRLFFLTILAIVLGAQLSPTALAQSTGSIWGSVNDASGAAIPGATVTVKNTETGETRTIVTDQTGKFDASALPVGHYEVTATKAGFRKNATTGVTLVVGQREEITLALEVGDVNQTVEVHGQPEAVAVTTEDISGLVGERQVKELPLNGRSYDQLLTLNPGVVNYTSQRAGSVGTSNSVVGNMFSASGRRPQENLFLLNGVEFTSASEIDNTPGGVSGQLLGVDSVREFVVVQNNYGAEYGKRPGAQVNIVTASGGNELHGAVYEFLRNSAMDARNFFDFGNIPEFQRNNFGAALGGPLKQDKSFLFGNYEGFRQNLGLSNLSFVPDATSRANAVPSVQPLMALWPVANGRELLTSTGADSGIAEAFTNPVQNIGEDYGTTRFDQVFSQKDSSSATYTIDDSRAVSPTTNPLTSADIFLREQVASVSETHIFSPTLLNQATLGFSRGAFYFNTGTDVDLPSWVQPGDPVGAVVVGGGTTLNGASQITNGGTNAGSNLTAVRNLFTFTDKLTVTHGIHLVNLGMWTERVQANDTLEQDQYGQVSFTSMQTFLAGTVSTYTFAPAYTPLSWRSTEGAAYIEDTIRLRPSLELELGFRGEGTNGWHEATSRSSNYAFSDGVIQTQPFIGDSPLTVNRAKFLPAPRVAVSWSPFGSKKTVIRAGAGMYYALLDNLSYRLDQNGPFNTVYAVKNIPFSDIAPDLTYKGQKVVPSGVQPDLWTPTVESWTLRVEQEITPSTSLSVGYIGSHGYHGLLSEDENLPSPTICPAAPCPASYPAGTLYYPSGAPLANPAVTNTTTWVSEGVSSYNGLQVDVNHRFNKGLQFRGVYTFSKALDDGDNMNTSVATNSPTFVSNPLDAMADYGRASFDIRHSAVINGTYALPFGRSKVEWANRAFGDWQISGIETIESGLPFTPQLSYNPSNDGDTRNPVRPSFNPNFTGPIVLGLPNEYFNPAAFIQPLAGTYGNAGRNILEGPNLFETDLALAKKFGITERLNLQFRAECFNILNHTNLNTPNPVVYTAATGGPSPTAGFVTSTATTSRQLQLGLKLLW
jgi:hypothetical protein